MNTGKSYISDELSEVHPALAIIAAKVWSFCGDGDECQISRDYLCRICGRITKDTLYKHISTLQEMGYIEYKSGIGRGNVSTFKKGEKLALLYNEKGRKKPSKKGEKLALKNINNNIISLRGDNNIKRTLARTQPPPLEKDENVMIQFEEFWQAFKPEGFDHERESCERQWLNMSEELRADVLKNLRGGRCKQRKAKSNPHWFLHDYKPMSVQLAKPGTRLTREQYYEKFGSDEVRPGWRFYKPAGYERFIFEKV